MDRVQTDLDAQRALMSCTSAADLMHVQSTYCRDTIRQYTDQATRMVGLMMTASAQATRDVASPNARKYDDIPL